MSEKQTSHLKLGEKGSSSDQPIPRANKTEGERTQTTTSIAKNLLDYLKALEAEMAEGKAELAATKAREDAADAQGLALKERAKKLENQLEQIKKELVEKAKENFDLQKELEEMEARLEQMEACLEDAKKANEQVQQNDGTILVRGISHSASEDPYKMTKFFEMEYIKGLANNVPLFNALCKNLKIKKRRDHKLSFDQKMEAACKCYSLSRQFYEGIKTEFPEYEHVNYQKKGCFGCYGRRAFFFTSKCTHFFCHPCARPLFEKQKCPCGAVDFGRIITLAMSFAPFRADETEEKNQAGGNSLQVPVQPSVSGSPMSQPEDDEESDDDVPSFHYDKPKTDDVLLSKLLFLKDIQSPKLQEVGIKRLLEKMGRKVEDLATLKELSEIMTQALFDTHRYEAVFQWLFNPRLQGKCSFCRTATADWGSSCHHLICPDCIITLQGGQQVCPCPARFARDMNLYPLK